MIRSSAMKPWLAGLALILAGCFDSNGSPEPPEPPANTPPVANAGADQVASTDATVNLDGGGSSDADGTISTWAWMQTGGTAVTLASAGTATPSFTAPASHGTLTFQLTVTDNGGASHSDTITVTVNAIPVADAGTDLAVSAGAAVSLAGSATDADGSIASYSWTQTSGPAVTLANAASPTATFTAPSATATLTFELTATDDRGAAHVDTVVVSVLLLTPPPDNGPAIARQPNNPIALEHGSAMLFVAASGEDLTYEWRRAGGTVVKSGPEPFLLLTNLFTSENGDCYYVVVSNDDGIETSEQGCLTVDNIDWRLDPSDDPENGDDRGYALGFGDSLMKITQTVTGPLTGRSGGAIGFPLEFGPPEDCWMGSYGGAVIDGVMWTPGATLPLGRHTLSEAWDECLTDPDDTSAQTATYLVEYDFPQTWGVGTITIHVSERYFNGSLHAMVTSTGSGGTRADEFEIVIPQDFSAGDLKTMNEHSISVERRYTSDGLSVDEAFVDFDVLMSAFDADGSAGTIGARQGTFFHLRQHFDDGDSGEPEFSSTGAMVVATGQYALATLEPSGTHLGWSFRLLPEDECPEGYVCVDQP
jgi:hypothetical protein